MVAQALCCPSSTYPLRREPAFLPMVIKLTCLVLYLVVTSYITLHITSYVYHSKGYIDRFKIYITFY